MTFLLPFLVYMAVGSFEPTPPPGHKGNANEEQAADEPAAETDGDNGTRIRYEHYPLIYTAKIALTIAAMLFVLPGYREFPFRISPLAIVVGVAGVVLWIWLCQLQLERKALSPLGLEKLLGLGERPAYNPLEQLADTPGWAYTFLAIRFFGLALVVPIIEEFFLRGFLMRYVIAERWWKLPFGTVTPLSVAVGTLIPMSMHPGELLAAAVWFTLVTWLMTRTRNIWDCVAAHAATNLLLGVYVVTQGAWHLW
ncbi:MAG: CAAX prenyl protease-related protein [Planctomycetes bacterium]|nr:CAAX prenyl protease-related protein [Planctomycetota bacterium]